MTLKVQIKSIYGQTYIYAACPVSQKFIKLLKVKTFTEHHVTILKELGYKFEVITQQL